MQLLHETLNIAQAKESLVTAATLYFLQDDAGRYRVARRRARPICLMGPAGIGKTEIVTQVAQELDLALCSYSLVHHTRQSLLGLPRLETCTIDGIDQSCTRYTMSEIVDAIHATMTATGRKKGILFLDEFNCVNESIRPVMLQLLQDKTLGTHAIPDGWMLVLAGNPTQYNKGAKELDAVTMDRLRILQVVPDLKSWLPYGRSHGIHPTVISFLEENPTCFYRHNATTNELVTPRGWEDLSVQLHLMEELGYTTTTAFIAQFFQSPLVSQQFFAYYRRYATLLSGGLLNQVFDRDPAVIAKVSGLSVQDRWALIAAILSRVQAQAQDIATQEETVNYVHSVLLSNRPQLKKGNSQAVDLLYALAGEAATPQGRTALLSCIDALQGNNVWTETKAYFQTNLVGVLNASTTKTLTQAENAIFICTQALQDAESAERLLHGLIDHGATAKLLASGDTPAFRNLCDSIHFDCDKAYQQLRKRLEAV